MKLIDAGISYATTAIGSRLICLDDGRRHFEIELFPERVEIYALDRSNDEEAIQEFKLNPKIVSFLNSEHNFVI